jgi:hypothetical protein
MLLAQRFGLTEKEKNFERFARKGSRDVIRGTVSICLMEGPREPTSNIAVGVSADIGKKNHSKTNHKCYIAS